MGQDSQAASAAQNALAARAAIERAFRQTPQLSAMSISWSPHETTVVLRGRVPSFYHKQLAQIAVTGLPGVERIVNEIEVCPNSARKKVVSFDADH